MSSITGQLKSRLVVLQKMNWNILGNESELFQNYLQYSKPLLERDLMSHICNKSDIESLFTEISRNFDTPIGPLKNVLTFESLLEMIEQGDRESIWEKLFKVCFPRVS